MQPVKPLKDTEILNKVIKIISRHIPQARIILFGSRAKGTNKPVSDFDIAVDTERIPVKTKFALLGEIEQLNTLKMVDVVFLNEVDPDFKEIILKTGKIIYDGSGVPAQ